MSTIDTTLDALVEKALKKPGLNITSSFANAYPSEKIDEIIEGSRFTPDLASDTEPTEKINQLSKLHTEALLAKAKEKAAHLGNEEDAKTLFEAIQETCTSKHHALKHTPDYVGSSYRDGDAAQNAIKDKALKARTLTSNYAEPHDTMVYTYLEPVRDTLQPHGEDTNSDYFWIQPPTAALLNRSIVKFDEPEQEMKDVIIAGQHAPIAFQLYVFIEMVMHDGQLKENIQAYRSGNKSPLQKAIKNSAYLEIEVISPLRIDLKGHKFVTKDKVVEIGGRAQPRGRIERRGITPDSEHLERDDRPLE